MYWERNDMYWKRRSSQHNEPQKDYAEWVGVRHKKWWLKISENIYLNATPLGPLACMMNSKKKMSHADVHGRPKPLGACLWENFSSCKHFRFGQLSSINVAASWHYLAQNANLSRLRCSDGNNIQSAKHQNFFYDSEWKTRFYTGSVCAFQPKQAMFRP